MAKVFLGIPNTGEIVAQGLMSVLSATGADGGPQHDLMVVPAGGSLLCLNFNSLWTSFLNLEEPADYFVMMHADQSVEPGWLDKLIGIVEETGADIVSCAIPIKDARGLLSAGLGKHTGEFGREHRRLTLTELKQLPETFGVEEVRTLFGESENKDSFLTFNTGCWIAKRGPWMETFPGFNIEDRVAKQPDGKFKAFVWPEDWKFSEWAGWCAGLNCKVTKAVKIQHIGVTSFPNHSVWGQPSDTFGEMA